MTVLIFCGQTCKQSNEAIDIIAIDSLRLSDGDSIILHQEGYYRLDSNAVLPQYDSILHDEYLIVKEMIESRTNFKLKSKWKIGNDSPSDGIWLNFSGDTTNGFYVINTTEGHIGIYGSSRQSIRNGIKLLESLFIKEFKGKEKRDVWYLPKIIVEHRNKQ